MLPPQCECVKRFMSTQGVLTLTHACIEEKRIEADDAATVEHVSLPILLFVD